MLCQMISPINVSDDSFEKLMKYKFFISVGIYGEYDEAHYMWVKEKQASFYSKANELLLEEFYDIE